MRGREWERLVNKHLLPAVTGHGEEVTHHHGQLLVGEVGWTACMIRAITHSRLTRWVNLVATVIVLPDGLHPQHMRRLQLDLGDGPCSGNQHWFDIPEDPDEQAPILAEMADAVIRQGLPWLRTLATPDHVAFGLRKAVKAAGRRSPDRALPLEELGCLDLARGHIRAGIDTLAEADALHRPYDDPPAPGHLRDRIRPVIDLARHDPDGVRRLLADRARDMAHELHLPEPTFDPPVP